MLLCCEGKRVKQKTQKADFLNKGILRNLQVHQDNNVWRMMHSLFTFKIAKAKKVSFSRDMSLKYGLVLIEGNGVVNVLVVYSKG